ncbi:hypothetical protein O988_00978 [Pseudogymnoascus sp. VKM F-3808]|nr:hypothetical protein O988_00978 [Pseudogymnoascus sp. VKM F-3808]
MSTFDCFDDFDDPSRHKTALVDAAKEDALNFVVDFGSRESRIASNVSSSNFKTLMTDGGAPRIPGAPARWINVWAPNLQPDVVEAIGLRYNFSARLKSILCTTPPAKSNEAPKESYTTEKGIDSRIPIDVEKGVLNHPTRSDSALEAAKPHPRNFFDIAANFSSYQSIDIGDKFICIGANWMHPVKRPSGIEPERLWSWLVLCDDATVISFHEALGSKGEDLEYLQTVRKHTLSVLSQLSKIGFYAADGVELISLRQPESANINVELTGVEGASNLFYYLFDDWTATYTLLRVIQGSLEKLRKKIMAGLNQPDALANEIIPKLYEAGKLLRSNQHLFKGYENLISRILEYKEGKAASFGRTDESISVAHTACHRFERLRDNIKFVVINYVDEAIGEIDGLHNTYFNITTQKDSIATAKLTANATLLSKLGVLFLPVSLMTSYFSVQIKELDGVYTVKTYWVTFAVIMVLSFVALFMFSRVLVGVGTAVAKQVDKVVARVKGRVAHRDSPTGAQNWIRTARLGATLVHRAIYLRQYLRCLQFYPPVGASELILSHQPFQADSSSSHTNSQACYITSTAGIPRQSGVIRLRQSAMVYNDTDNPKPDRGFEDPTPQSDSDRYDEFKQPPNLQRFEGTYLPRPFIGARMLGLNDAKVAVAIDRGINDAQGTLGRPVTADEASAFAYWTAKHLQVFSYGPATGFAAGMIQAYRTRSTFRFPFVKPNPDKFNPKVFPSTRLALVTGMEAIPFWHVTRVAAYSTVGILVGTMFFATYASSVAAVGMVGDKRLKDYLESIKVKAARNAPGTAPGRSPQPGSSPQPVYGNQTGPAVQATGYDASPSNDSYWGTSNDGPSNGGLADADTSRESQLPAQSQKSYSSRRGTQPAPAADKEPSYESGGFDDASPTGGVGVTDEMAPGESAWERLRRQGASSGGQQPKSSSQSSQPPQADTSAQNGWGNDAAAASSGQEPEKRQMSAREIAQREFDEQVERERQGGSFNSRG